MKSSKAKTSGASAKSDVSEHVSSLSAVAGTFTQIEPNSIVLSPYSNRAASDKNDPSYKELKRLITLTGGNVTSAVVSVEPNPQVPGQDMNVLISGHRVWEVCKELNMDLNVVLVKGMSALEITRHMSMSNSGRKSLSALEAGRSFVKYLEAGLFASQAELARELGIAESDVSNAIKLAKLPELVVAAFASPDDIQHKFAKALADAVKADLKNVLLLAKRLAKGNANRSKKLTGAEVVEALTGVKIGTSKPAKSAKAEPAAEVDVGQPEREPDTLPNASATPMGDSDLSPSALELSDRLDEAEEGEETEDVPTSSSRALLRGKLRAVASTSLRSSKEWSLVLGQGAVVGTLTRFESGAIRMDLESAMGLTHRDCIDLVADVTEFLEPRAFSADTDREVEVDVDVDVDGDGDGDGVGDSDDQS